MLERAIRKMSKDLVIRDMVASDIVRAVEIINDNYSDFDMSRAREELESMFSQVRIRPHYVVALDNNKIIGLGGYIQSFMDYGVYEIFWINIDKAHQSKGLGTRIVECIIEKIKAHSGDDEANLIILTASVLKSLPKFYSERFGFKVLETMQSGENTIMGLRLK